MNRNVCRNSQIILSSPSYTRFSNIRHYKIGNIRIRTFHVWNLRFPSEHTIYRKYRWYLFGRNRYGDCNLCIKSNLMRVLSQPMTIRWVPMNLKPHGFLSIPRIIETIKFACYRLISFRFFSDSTCCVIRNAYVSELNRTLFTSDKIREESDILLTIYNRTQSTLVLTS